MTVAERIAGGRDVVGRGPLVGDRGVGIYVRVVEASDVAIDGLGDLSDTAHTSLVARGGTARSKGMPVDGPKEAL